MRVRSWAATDTGRTRDHNEDCLLADDAHGLYAVADGVGGALGGEVASRTTVDRLAAGAASLARLMEGCAQGGGQPAARKPVFDALGRLVDSANQIVFDRSQREAELKGMATTLSLAAFSSTGAHIVHVGDSRIYLFRQGQLHRITEDHTFAQDLVRRGELKPEDVPTFKYRNVIVRSVGGSATVRPDFLFIETQPDDVFLFCSDGLTDYVGEPDVLRTLLSYGAGGSAQRLVDLANQGGGGDNITVVLARVTTEAAEAAAAPVEESPTQRLMHTHKLAFLRNRFFFQHLTHDELMKVLRCVYDEEFAARTPVVRQGERGDDLYFVAEGVVDVYVNDVLVTSISVGGHFGELALISGEARSATVVARTPTRLLRMSREDFYDLSERDQSVAVKILWAFLQTLGERVKSLSQQVVTRR
jgi:serine/threonine protein phosphatase PrpC